MVWYWQTNASGLTALRHIPVKYWTDIMTADCNPWTFQARKGEDISSNLTTITGNVRVVVVLQDSVPPVAVADDVVAELGEETVLDGSLSTDNGIIVSWLWTFDDGIGIVVLEGEVVNWTFVRLGAINATLNVTDGVGLHHEVGFNITVVDTTAPVVRVGENMTVDQATLVDLDGTNTTDNDPTILATGTFVWSIYLIEDDDYKGGVEGPFGSYRFDDMGTFRVLLEVWDQSLNHGSSSFYVTVMDTEAPQVDAGEDIRAHQFATVLIINGIVGDNDPEFPETGHVWWHIEGEGLEVNLTELYPRFIFNESGEYIATLYALDAAGNLGWDEIEIDIIDNEDPLVDAGTDMTVLVGTTVTLRDNGTTDNDPAFPSGAVFEWHITGPPDINITWKGDSVNFQVPWIGEYIVVLTVTDAERNRGSDTITITSVDDIAPVITAFEPSPEELMDSGTMTVVVALEDVGTGIDNGSLRYRLRRTTSEEWNAWQAIPMDDAGHRADLNIDLDLPEGESLLQFAALDLAGNALDDGEGHLIRVNSRPVVIILSPAEGADFGPYDNILLNASGSYDVDPGDSLTFHWFSDIDGLLGAGMSRRGVLSPGTHRISVIVSDGIEDHDVTADVNVTVRPVPSTISQDEFPWTWIILVAAIIILGVAVWDARRQRGRPPTPTEEETDLEEGVEEADQEDEEEGGWEPIDGGG
jgi:hypothetical protein